MLGLGLGLARVSLNRFLLSPLTVNPNIPHCSMPFLQQTLTVPLGINKVILILNLLPIFQVTVLLRSESPQEPTFLQANSVIQCPSSHTA